MDKHKIELNENEIEIHYFHVNFKTLFNMVQIIRFRSEMYYSIV